MKTAVIYFHSLICRAHRVVLREKKITKAQTAMISDHSVIMPVSQTFINTQIHYISLFYKCKKNVFKDWNAGKFFKTMFVEIRSYSKNFDLNKSLTTLLLHSFKDEICLMN